MSNVSLTPKQYDDMMMRLSKLQALESAGVDNWDGYDSALTHWYTENKKKELANDFVAFVNELLVEADLEQPAGPGCGYSITFDEEELSNQFLSFCKEYVSIELRNNKG